MALPRPDPPFPPLAPAAIRDRLARFRGSPGADRAGTEGAALPAAVLALVVGRDQPTLLFTQRAPDLHAHGGQISFPGGRIEPGEDPVAAALREAREEVGLAADGIEILGRLPEYRTVTGFLVHPIVAWTPPPLTLTPDPREVAEAFELPLAAFLAPDGLRRESRVFGSHRAEFWAIDIDGRHVWGATAAIIAMLKDALS